MDHPAIPGVMKYLCQDWGTGPRSPTQCQRLSAAAPFREVPLGVCHAMASNRPPLLSWENSGGYKR